MSHWDDKTADDKAANRNLPAVITATVPAATTLDLAPEAWRLAEKIAGTPFVPDALRGKPEAVLACMLTGNELGLPLMVSLSKVHVINGRPGLASETMRSLVLAAGHELWVESKSNTAVTVGGKRAGSSREQRVTWTIEDATAAKLKDKDVWKAYPRAMLTARAMSELCRDMFPDVIGGLYSTEELNDGFDFEQLADETVPAAEPRKALSSPAAKKRAATRAKVAAGAGPEPEPPALPDDDDEVVEAELVDDDDPPELPDDEQVPDASAAEGAPVPVARAQRTQQIAMRARELDLDRALVISAVTDGDKTSARELDDDEADLVLDALRRLKVGEIRLSEVDGRPRLVDAPRAENGDDGGDDEAGQLFDDAALATAPEDGLGWRSLIKAKGKTLSATLAKAKTIAAELEGVEAPTDATALSQADDRVKAAVLAWLDGAS